MILQVAIVLLAVPATLAQTVALWGQCGGLGYTGGTTCASGSYCYVQNAYYSQCLPGTASTTLATSTTVTPTTGTSIVSSSATSATASSSAVPKYIFSFGDSYSQTGFDITGTKPSASNPIGNPTFPGYTSSGGTNWLGYLVTQYNPTTALSYNFASGGAGINTTIISTYGTPLTTQVATFLSNLGSKPSYAPWTSADSLFVFWIGINDIGNSYYLSVDQDALHTQLMDTIFNLVQQLYAVGAKNFLFMSVPPIEKTPLMISQSTASALALEAAQIADFNSKLVSRAAAWNQGKSQTSIYQFDTQVPFNQIIASPATYGYSDATSVCQTSACMWWDNYHPSTGVHKVIAGQVATLLKTGFW